MIKINDFIQNNNLSSKQKNSCDIVTTYSKSFHTAIYKEILLMEKTIKV